MRRRRLTAGLRVCRKGIPDLEWVGYALRIVPLPHVSGLPVDRARSVDRDAGNSLIGAARQQTLGMIYHDIGKPFQIDFKPNERESLWFDFLPYFNRDAFDQASS